MTRDRLIEIVVGAASGAALLVLGGVGWLVVQTFDLKGKVSALDSNLTDTNGRVERMASAMPSVVVRLAQQEVKSPAKAMVVATKPVETSPNKWASTILVFDLDAASVTSYSVPLASQFDKAAYTTTTGAALATERHAQSFQDLETSLRNLQDTTQIADVIVPYASFLLRSASAADYKASFKVLHGTDSARVKTMSVGAARMTWQSINGELAKHPDKYQPMSVAPPERDRRY